jgi:hypothetical protein
MASVHVVVVVVVVIIILDRLFGLGHGLGPGLALVRIVGTLAAAERRRRIVLGQVGAEAMLGASVV